MYLLNLGAWTLLAERFGRESLGMHPFRSNKQDRSIYIYIYVYIYIYIYTYRGREGLGFIVQGLVGLRFYDSGQHDWNMVH